MLIIPHRSIHSHLFIHNNGLKLAKVKQHICYVHFWSFLGLFLERPSLNSVEVEIFAWHVCTFWNPYKKHYQKNLKLKCKLLVFSIYYAFCEWDCTSSRTFWNLLYRVWFSQRGPKEQLPYSKFQKVQELLQSHTQKA